MANEGLPRRFLNVKLTGGVNKKSDSHQLQNGELLTADNVSFSTTPGQVRKRNGNKPVTPAGAPFQGAPFKALGMRDAKEPLILGQNVLNRYNYATALSTSLPTPTQGRLNLFSVVGSSGVTVNPCAPVNASMASDGSQYICVAWEERGNGTSSVLFYGVQDIGTGNWIISPTYMGGSDVASWTNPPSGHVYNYAGVSSPLVRYYNGAFYICYLWFGLYATGAGEIVTRIYARPLVTSNLAAGLQASTLVSVVNPAYLPPNNGSAPLPPAVKTAYDVHIASNGTYVSASYQPSTGSPQVVCSFGTMGAGIPTVFNPSSSLNFTLTATGSAIPRIAVRADGPAAYPFAIATNSEFFVVSSTYTFTSTFFGSPLNPVTAPVDCLWVGNTPYMVATVQNSTQAVYYMFILALNPSTGVANGWYGLNTPLKGAPCEILSRLFLSPVNTNKLCFWVGEGGSSSDSIYSNAYLLETDRPDLVGSVNSRVVTRTLYPIGKQSGAYITGGDRLFPTDVVASGTNYVTMLSGLTEKGPVGTAYGVLNRTEFEFVPTRAAQILPLPPGGNLIAGAYPLYYDGAQICEAGFSATPTCDVMQNTMLPALSNPTVTNSGSGLSGLPGGSGISYSYQVCFVRRDAYGNVYRSAPSPPIAIACPNAGNYVNFPAYSYTGGGYVTVEIYRNTQIAPGTHYFVSEVPIGAAYTDSAIDITIAAGNQIIYTDAGELPNDPPPAVYHAAVGENRVYIIPADNRNLVLYSKKFAPGRTVEWNAALTLSEGQNAGLFTAVAVLDANIIIFKTNSILYTYGSGPDNTGANGGFAPLQNLPSDVGCIDPASVAEIPEGIVFRSWRGIELLTRNLQVQYIGAPVESIVATNGPFSSAIVMPGQTQLRLVPAYASYTTPINGSPVTVAPSVLVYDYAGNRWSTYSGMASVQAYKMINSYWWISADGLSVNNESVGQYLDNGAPYTMTLETPEIPVGEAGIQGWGRAYRLALLGDFYSAHTLNLSFCYDHAGTYTDTTTFNTSSGLISGDTVYQLRCSRLPRSVMQTVRIKITDSNTTGQSCAISNLVLEVGSKNGIAHLGPAKTV